ncbi:SDR family NAD(P)-dependent oxidoreductase [Pseudomonas citronellolis]|uniref:SDR family NAD(P)-dependent oxidoreductase n=1 Tax=Pseudomonas citronellolis TaxID=53408 RepID=UPI0021C07A36|nr:SDR family oxidoreductase [Pseudomonas citronellolis]UXJ50186.1 SDR family oxidoreductase [Pseudomonas citronellolis]
MKRLQNKVAVVTGAASGIGLAAARRLAEEGAQVVLADINLGAAQHQASTLLDEGLRVAAVQVDLGDEVSIASMIERTVSLFAGLDVLFNNAAATHLSSRHDAPIESMDTQVWDDTMRINLRGTMLATKYAIASMLPRGGGSIINTSSGAGQAGALGYSAYAVSKAGIENLTRYVAAQHGKQGIRCNAVAPGLIVTPATADNYAGPAGEMMLAHHLTPRLGNVGDIANAVLFLASDEAAFITGQIINVDGGLLSHQPYYADEMRLRQVAQESAS